MIIDKNKEMITIKVNKLFKDKIIEQSKLLNKSVSEFIRDSINNELTNNDIAQNQSYLYGTLDTIINNILDEKLIAINKILKLIYIQNELLMHLLKTFDDMSINYSNYIKLKQNYYIKRFVYNKLVYNALEHIKYENERIEKEIVESMRAELEY